MKDCLPVVIEETPLLMLYAPLIWSTYGIQRRNLCSRSSHPSGLPLTCRVTASQLLIEPIAAAGDPLEGHGGSRVEEGQVVVSHLKPANQLSSDSQERLLRRIARDQPVLLVEIGPGKPHRSVRYAAIAAGIIKPVLQAKPMKANLSKSARPLHEEINPPLWSNLPAILALY